MSREKTILGSARNRQKDQKITQSTLSQLIAAVTSSVDKISWDHPLWKDLDNCVALGKNKDSTLICDENIFSTMEKMGHALKFLILMKISNRLFDVAECLLHGKRKIAQNEINLPSLRDLEILLLYLQNATEHICNILHFSEEVLSGFLQKLNNRIDNREIILKMCRSISSVCLMYKVLLVDVCCIYNSLKPFCNKLIGQSLQLPDGHHLPEDIWKSLQTEVLLKRQIIRQDWKFLREIPETCNISENQIPIAPDDVMDCTNLSDDNEKEYEESSVSILSENEETFKNYVSSESECSSSKDFSFYDDEFVKNEEEFTDPSDNLLIKVERNSDVLYNETLGNCSINKPGSLHRQKVHEDQVTSEGRDMDNISSSLAAKNVVKFEGNCGSSSDERNCSKYIEHFMVNTFEHQRLDVKKEKPDLLIENAPMFGSSSVSDSGRCNNCNGNSFVPYFDVDDKSELKGMLDIGLNPSDRSWYPERICVNCIPESNQSTKHTSLTKFDKLFRELQAKLVQRKERNLFLSLETIYKNGRSTIELLKKNNRYDLARKIFIVLSNRMKSFCE